MGSFAKKATGFLSNYSVTRKVVGNKTFSKIDLGGQLSGQYDDNYKPADIAPIPDPRTGTDSLMARDRIRRQAKRAQGLDSTVRTSAAGALYSPNPKSLLGS